MPLPLIEVKPYEYNSYTISSGVRQIPALHAPSRLHPRVRAELRNPANELWLSPVSTWEALLGFPANHFGMSDRRLGYRS